MWRQLDDFVGRHPCDDDRACFDGCSGNHDCTDDDRCTNNRSADDNCSNDHGRSDDHSRAGTVGAVSRRFERL